VACAESGSKQRREGETDRPHGQRPARATEQPSWLESVRLAHQAVVAFASAGMRNRAEPRACGCSCSSIWAWTLSQADRRTAVPASNVVWKDHGRALGRELRFQPYWGKPTVRNDKRGWRKRGHELMAVCHDARKSRYIGSHCSKPIAPPPYST